jgi:hypothetical protein
MDAVRHNLLATIYQAGLSNATIARLRRDSPEGEWSFNGDVVLYQDTLWLHFADASERRMWWVRVDDEDDEVAMTWDIGEISDLV